MGPLAGRTMLEGTWPKPSPINMAVLGTATTIEEECMEPTCIQTSILTTMEDHLTTATTILHPMEHPFPPATGLLWNATSPTLVGITGEADTMEAAAITTGTGAMVTPMTVPFTVPTEGATLTGLTVAMDTMGVTLSMVATETALATTRFGPGVTCTGSQLVLTVAVGMGADEAGTMMLATAVPILTTGSTAWEAPAAIHDMAVGEAAFMVGAGEATEVAGVVPMATEGAIIPMVVLALEAT